ncbi:FAD-dependent monooxygenase [Methylobacterium sp. J-072]|uniref:FAD-dependent monooxygenase n=1 Tax=Methylobacterium sp. J-072 TaxID=2836651 RepID=UPI001FB99F9A|nr:FAD-dependent monooxygenase [Methylobacterium sp. J-072]MCJ2092160.1 FAD-dependent monooxygenase [Methylobacterium sp. J-072]
MTPSVLIVGAGPVGMTLASELTRYGVGVRIVDQAAQRTDKSKAMVLWSRTLELLDRGGTQGAASFVDAGFKVEGVTFVAGNEVVGRVAMDAIPSVHAYALAIPQSETERLLEERLVEQGLTVERSTQATSFTMGADGVEATLQRADGTQETVWADWLVGCDGAHSAVRHALDMPFAGETLLSDWFLADVHMTGYPRTDTDASIHWHSDGVLLIFPIQAGRYRIIGDLPYTDAKTAPVPTLEQVQALVDRRGPAGTTLFDPVWLSGFRINGRKVAAYRQGRAFLAGDAAHVHSPAGGQGMNTGMQDAVNLAWKLALVVHGRAEEALLDSYSSERSAVGDEVLKAAERLTSVATLKNPVAQGVRNAVGRLLLGLPSVSHGVADTMSEVAIHYANSPLNGPSAREGVRPGERVPPVAGQVPVGAGVAPQFALFAEPSAAIDDIVTEFGDLVEADVRPALHAGTISLVRPDGYLACSAAKPEAIAAYLARIATHADRAPVAKRAQHA